MLGVALIIISIATAVALIFNSFFAYLRNRSNILLLQKHIEAGHALDGEVLRMVNQPTENGMPDIRKAVLLIALGVAGALFSQFVEGAENVRMTLGLSLFPVVLGIGYMISMWIEKRMAG